MTSADIEPALAVQLLDLLPTAPHDFKLGYIREKNHATLGSTISIEALAELLLFVQVRHSACRPQHFLPSDSRLGRKHQGPVTLFGIFTTIQCLIGRDAGILRPPMGKGYCCLVLLRGSCKIQIGEESSQDFTTLKLHTVSIHSHITKKSFKLELHDDTYLLVFYLDTVVAACTGTKLTHRCHTDLQEASRAVWQAGNYTAVIQQARKGRMKVQKKRARVTPCKECIRHKKCRRDQEATIRAEKVSHKKIFAQKKQVKNSSTRGKKALQQERPCTPRTEDANPKKIVADTSRSSIKKVDKDTSTSEKWQLLLVEHYLSGH